MEIILLVLFILFVVMLSYGFDYLFELSFFKEMDMIERALS
jgi:hypothetical protein